MFLSAAAPLLDPTAAIVASVLMLVAGVAKKRLSWRNAECRVCHHPKGSCTCRWL